MINVTRFAPSRASERTRGGWQPAPHLTRSTSRVSTATSHAPSRNHTPFLHDSRAQPHRHTPFLHGSRPSHTPPDSLRSLTPPSRRLLTTASVSRKSRPKEGGGAEADEHKMSGARLRASAADDSPGDGDGNRGRRRGSGYDGSVNDSRLDVADDAPSILHRSNEMSGSW